MKNNNNFYNEYEEYEEYDDGKKKYFIIAGIVILVIALIVGVFFLKKKIEVSSLEKKAQSLVEMEDYDEALKVYSDLYTKTGDIKYKSSKNQIAIKKEAKDTIKDAKEQEQNGNLVKAIVLYKMILKEDEKNYQYASSQIDSLKNEIIRKASSLIDSGNNSEASSILSDYISVVPDDKKAIELYKKVSGKSDKEVEKVIVEKNVPVVISDNNSNSSKPSVAYKTANAITNTWQYITSKEANIRSNPSKNSSVVGTLSRGDEVYIEDTYVESESRIWCKTDFGWISYNTMNNTIK